MPLGAFEGRLLRLLAVNRSPDSFIAGATVLHQAGNSPRTSQDIDVFHDAAEAVALSAERDLATLAAAGFTTKLVTQQPYFWRAQVWQDELKTKLEWVQDSAFRFFPVEPDVELGWRLNFWDAATNKVLALAGREKLRDKIDVIFLHRSHLSFGALAWAAAGKDPGMTPEMILEMAMRFGRIPATREEWASVGMPVPDDLPAWKREFLEMLESARELFARLPAVDLGCLYLDPLSLQPVLPEPGTASFDGLIRHQGRIGGAWPRVVS